MDARTIPELILRAYETYRKPDAFLVKRAGRWEPVAMASVLTRVRALTDALRARGVARGERVVLLAESSLEWALADMAIMSLGAVTVPIYPTLPAHEIGPLLADSGAVGAFASTKEQREKLESARGAGGGGGSAPALRWVWCYGEEALPGGASGESTAIAAGEGVASVDLGDERAGAAASIDLPKPEDLASIIYTSGTTGVPKGVMLTHANLVAQARIALEAMPISTNDIYLSFLPLSHVLERGSGLYTMLAAGATVAYAESFDRMAANLLEVRPTIIMAVPRFYEKVLARATDAAAAAGFPRAQLFRWAVRVAMDWAERRTAGRAVSPGLAFQHALAGALVYSMLAKRFGGRVHLRISGGAPLNREVALFFLGVGQPILQGYGLTETSSAICVHRFDGHRIGTVGPPFPEVEVRIAEDGEILVRGPVIMKGYWNRPKETAEALQDGWLHTGDIGAIDPDSHLRITDRKKDLIVTSIGKKVAPQPIEEALKSSPRIQEALVLGDGRKYLGALIVPTAGVTREEIGAEIERVNETLAPFEKIRKFDLIPDDLSVESGALTPSLKLKRKQVADRYRDVIERLFAGA